MFYYWSINTNVVSLVFRPEMFETAIKESTSSSKSPPSKHFAKKKLCCCYLPCNIGLKNYLKSSYLDKNVHSDWGLC